jgi:hypothetical protein
VSTFLWGSSCLCITLVHTYHNPRRYIRNILILLFAFLRTITAHNTVTIIRAYKTGLCLGKLCVCHFQWSSACFISETAEGVFIMVWTGGIYFIYFNTCRLFLQLSIYLSIYRRRGVRTCVYRAPWTVCKYWNWYSATT